MLTRQGNKREENSSKLASKTSDFESKNKPAVQTRKGFPSRIAHSKPPTSKPQKPTLSRFKSSPSTSAELDKSTISESLIGRRVKTQRAQIRPDYKEDSSSGETERDQEKACCQALTCHLRRNHHRQYQKVHLRKHQRAQMNYSQKTRSNHSL